MDTMNLDRAWEIVKFYSDQTHGKAALYDRAYAFIMGSFSSTIDDDVKKLKEKFGEVTENVGPAPHGTD